MSEFETQNPEDSTPKQEGEGLEVNAESGGLQALKQKAREAEQLLGEAREKTAEENVRNFVEPLLNNDNEGVRKLITADGKDDLLGRYPLVADMWTAKMDEWMERVRQDPNDTAAQVALNLSSEYLKTK